MYNGIICMYNGIIEHVHVMYVVQVSLICGNLCYTRKTTM